MSRARRGVNERDPEIVFLDLRDGVRAKSAHRGRRLDHPQRLASASRRNGTIGSATCCDPADPATSMTRLQMWVSPADRSTKPNQLPELPVVRVRTLSRPRQQVSRLGASGRKIPRWFMVSSCLELEQKDTSVWALITGRFLALATGGCLTVGCRFHIRFGSADLRLVHGLCRATGVSRMKRVLTIAAY